MTREEIRSEVQNITTLLTVMGHEEWAETLVTTFHRLNDEIDKLEHEATVVSEHHLQRFLANRREFDRLHKHVETLEAELNKSPTLRSIDEKLTALTERLYNKEERRPQPQQYDERARFWLFLKETGNTDKYIEFYAPPETRNLFTQIKDMKLAIDELLLVQRHECNEGCERGNAPCGACKWQRKWGPRIK